jgi:uncharacterized protein
MKRADRAGDKPSSLREQPLSRANSAAMAAASCGVAVMAKASAPGRAKTRLVPPLTFDAAAALNTAFLKDVAANLLLAARRATTGAAIVGYAAYGPPDSETFFDETFGGAIGLIPAWLPNFGDCLMHAIREIFARGHASAVVLNADSPTLPTALLNETAEILAHPGDRAVLGPSRDGGYYLLGLKAAHERMFQDIAWSTERVAEQTRARASEIGLDVDVLPLWYDVDDVEDLRLLHAQLCGDNGAPTGGRLRPHQARYSKALLQSLWPDGDFGRIQRRAPIAPAHV